MPELELARGPWSVPLPADGRRILLFSGVGGIGKSALARRIIRDLKDEWASDAWLDMAKPAYAAIDLAETWSPDVVQALLQRRLQLGTTWREVPFRCSISPSPASMPSASRARTSKRTTS